MAPTTAGRLPFFGQTDGSARAPKCPPCGPEQLARLEYGYVDRAATIVVIGAIASLVWLFRRPSIPPSAALQGIFFLLAAVAIAFAICACWSQGESLQRNYDWPSPPDRLNHCSRSSCTGGSAKT